MNRAREVGRLRHRLQRLHSPRLQMFLIVALTGAAGFLVSTALLDIGVSVLWQRYALAVAVAYGVFLLLLRAWVRLHDRSLNDTIDLSVSNGDSGRAGSRNGGSTNGDSRNGDCRSESEWSGGGGRSGGGGVSAHFGDGRNASTSTKDFDLDGDAIDALPDALPDVGELGLVLFAIAIVGAAAVGALWVVWIAPTLLAELIFDVAIASGLYRRLRRIESGTWLRTAVRRTFWPFLLTLAVFAVVGAGAQAYDPAIDSIGDLFAAGR